MPTAKRAGLRILVADDETGMRETLVTILESDGHIVLGVPDGETALVELQKEPLPDVLIMDVVMPGLGGAGTLPILRGLYPGLPVLLISGRSDASVIKLSRSFDYVMLLGKPFTMRELRLHLRSLTKCPRECDWWGGCKALTQDIHCEFAMK